MAKNNSVLIDSIVNRADEFYTTYEYVDAEVKYYKSAFENKVIYCPCDDYRWSNFVKYFKDNFTNFKLKKLIASCYNPNGHGTLYIYDGNTEVMKEMFSNGDFLGEEVKSVMRHCDIVVTNPPFSLIRHFIKELEDCNLKYLFVCTMLFFTNPFVFDLFKSGKVTFGVQGDHGHFITNTKDFENQISVTKKGLLRLKDSRWITNIFIKENDPAEKPFLQLTKEYDEKLYPKLDKPYEAINVNKTYDIPKDYDDIMAVPVSFVDKWNPKQFELLRIAKPALNRKNVFTRLFLRKKIDKRK